jgi:signal transduction histidine kinase/serine phosphatase RsbU (regulator of sigma subunit)/CheY-like chemotaxis protein/anti-sigma regulatory factor (Ser/Thr protein kinase)
MSSGRTKSGISAEVPLDLAAAARLGGEMGQRLISFDWESHPLGPLANWPVEIRTVVATSLVSRFPVVLWLEQDLFLVYNDGYIPMLGEKHPGALGSPASTVWSEIWDVVGPMLQSVVRTGVPTWSDDLMLMLASSGRPEERYFTFTYSPIIASGGAVPGVFCAVTETTDRVVGERRLVTLNALAAEVMDKRAAADVVTAAVEVCTEHDADVPFVAVYLDDPAARQATLCAATPRIAHQLSQHAATASAWGWPERFGHGEHAVVDLADPLQSLMSALNRPAPQRAALMALTDVPGARPAGLLVLGLNPHRPFDHQYEGFCRLLADQLSAGLANATSHEFEHRRAESLAELDRAKTAFLTNVSHEFRTPLALIMGPVEDALEQAGGDPGLTERLETVLRNSNRLLRLVNSLLDFARIEAGSSAPKLEPVDVGALTEQIASSFSEVCERAGIELILRCEPAVGEVDPDMWETIVLNLISNAFKFTLEGSITVSVAPAGSGEIDVSVADTGTGIAQEDLQRLFERFFRPEGAGGRSAEGSGIGLALVRSLVELHGGTIGLESQLGQGTRAAIRLPARQVDRAAAVHGAEPGLRGAAPVNPYVVEALQWLGDEPTEAPVELPSRPLILIADDNADMRRHLERILRPRWRTVCVTNGEAALEFIRAEHPDLLITDVMMPMLDGFGLVATIRADEALAELPVIMLSARAGIESSAEGFAAGADDYLVKPFGSKDLLNRVAARLDTATRARHAAERHELSEQRMTALAELSGELARATSVSEAVAILLRSPIASLGASAASIGMLEQPGDLIRLAYAGDLPGEFVDRYHVIALDAPVPIADVIRDGRPMLIADIADLDRRYAAVARDAAPALRAVVLEPLRASDGRVVGALSLSWPVPHRLEQAEVDLAEQVAQIMVQAVERIAISEREHRIATELQERLLDLQVRSTSAVVSASYEPAGELLRVGGDWYTATTLDEHGRIGISVGDVVGHGLPAATTMSQLRSALGAAALTSLDPTAVIDLLDRYASRVSGAGGSTVAYAVIDASNATVSYSAAGHPYPLLIRADGAARFLEDGRRPPLASAGVSQAGVSQSGPSGHSELPVGSLLVLYTDGLIERRGESLDDGLRRLANAAASCVRLPAADVCSTLLETLAPPGGYSDDAALVVVRPSGTTPESFILALVADRSHVTSTRHRLREWLRASPLNLDETLQFDVLLCVGEALTNAIEHGSTRGTTGAVWLEVFAQEDRVLASVSDSGRWATDSAASRREASRGRGLTLIHGLSDEVKMVRTLLGTRVTMSFRADRRTKSDGR